MKKRILTLTLGALLAMSLCACGNDTEYNAPEAGPTDATETPSQKEEYYFADNVLVAEDVRIEITDYKVIPAGGDGNEYSDKPVIAFWYNTTNLSGNENVTPMTSWIAMFSAFQDTDPNLVNELNIGSLPDDTFLDTQMETIKLNGTAPCAVSYELDDLSVPVVLKATKGVGGINLGEQTFEIEGK